MGEDDAAGNKARDDWDIANALSEPIAVLDKKGRIVAVNAAWHRAEQAHAAHDPGNPGDLGDPGSPDNPKGSGAAIIGTRYLDACRDRAEVALPPAESIRPSLQALLAGHLERFSFVYSAAAKGKTKNGKKEKKGQTEEFWFQVRASRLPDGKGAVLSHFGLDDMAERGGTRYAIFRGQSLFNDILEETMDGVFLCDPAGRLLVANSALANWLGKPLSEVLGQKVARVVSPEIGRLVLEQNADTIAAGKARTFELSTATAHGFRTFLVTKGLHRTHKGRVKGVFGIARDISELKAMEREIIDTSDKEKQRLGQELHENLCQYLVGISLLGNALYEELLRMKIKQAEDARQITTLVKESISEVRLLVKGLAPMPLEQEEGLISALQELAEQARVIGKIRCSLRVPRTANFVQPAAAMHLYRIAQEAVHNAIKHARAKRLQITLVNSRRAVVLTVQDDGIGFSRAAPLPSDNSSGLGLHIMNYRSRAIGAELEIRKLPKGGTAVVCTMPK